MGIIIKNFGWILKRLWTRNGLLKWQHYICHTKKWKMWTQKNVKVVSKLTIKSKKSLNEEFINEVH